MPVALWVAVMLYREDLPAKGVLDGRQLTLGRTTVVLSEGMFATLDDLVLDRVGLLLIVFRFWKITP